MYFRFLPNKRSKRLQESSSHLSFVTAAFSHLPLSTHTGFFLWFLISLFLFSLVSISLQPVLFPSFLPQLQPSLILQRCSFGLLRLALPRPPTPILCLFGHIFPGTVHPANTFYGLNPFFHFVFTGLGAGIDLPPFVFPIIHLLSLASPTFPLCSPDASLLSPFFSVFIHPLESHPPSHFLP